MTFAESRQRFAAWAAALATLLIVAATAAPALASSQYQLHGHFKGPAATFRPTSVAVNNAVNPATVYVGDYDNKAIDRFSAAGAYECQITGKGENSTSASECDSTKGASAEVPGALGAAVVVYPGITAPTCSKPYCLAK